MGSNLWICHALMWLQWQSLTVTAAYNTIRSGLTDHSRYELVQQRQSFRNITYIVDIEEFNFTSKYNVDVYELNSIRNVQKQVSIAKVRLWNIIVMLQYWKNMNSVGLNKRL